MNLAETAKLIVQLDLKGNLSTGISKIRGQLAGLNVDTNRLSGGLKTIGAGLGVAFIRGATLAVGAIGSITGAVVAMAREGQEAAKSHVLFSTAIANSGQVSTTYVGILKAQQTALMKLAGVDDELIEAEQTKLIQMGLTGEAVAKLTPLVLDLSTATGIDLLEATKAVGKAVNGSAGSLTRYGVFVDKAKYKTDPLVAVMEALNQKFGGTTKALSGTLETKLKVFNEGLANIREEAGIKLLPALTRLVDMAGTKLVPAFGKFIDRILPSLISGIDDLAELLASGGVEKGINTITTAVGPMVEVLKMAVGPVQALVKAFLALPQGLQAGLISGFLINKLSGGLVASGSKEVLGSLAGPTVGAGFTAILGKLGFTRGASIANPLYVADVTGGKGQLPAGLGSGGLIAAFGGAAAILGIGYLIGQGIVDYLGGPVAGTKDAGAGRPVANILGVPIVMGQSTPYQVRQQSLAKQAQRYATRHLASGSWDDPGGPAVLHRGEMVLPGVVARAVRNNVRSSDKPISITIDNRPQVSISDVNNRKIVRARWGPTAAEAGAA